MNKKIDITKILGSKWFGLVLAGAAAVSAFTGEMASQRKEKEFEDLVKRVSELEQK